MLFCSDKARCLLVNCHLVAMAVKLSVISNLRLCAFVVLFYTKSSNLKVRKISQIKVCDTRLKRKSYEN